MKTSKTLSVAVSTLLLAIIATTLITLTLSHNHRHIESTEQGSQISHIHNMASSDTDATRYTSSSTPSSPHFIQNTQTQGATSTETVSLYANSTHNFQFEYPADWRLDDTNLLRGGYFQLFNYDPNTIVGNYFRPDSKINKIEGVINVGYPRISEPSYEYPQAFHAVNTLVINGHNVLREDVTYESGLRLVSYSLPIPSTPAKTLRLNMYGNPNNFYVLDNIVLSFTNLRN